MSYQAINEALALARIKRMKRRIEKAWMARTCQCPKCVAVRNGLPVPLAEPRPIVALMARLSGDPDGGTTPPPSTPKH